MQRLLDVPADDALSVDNADWVELTALFAPDGNTSREDLARALRRPGLVSENRARQMADEAFDELADRIHALTWPASRRTKLYPFKLVRGGEVLQTTFNGLTSEHTALVYIFLLTMSRWSMHARHRRLKNIDPTATFERICADVLIAYWGGPGRFAGGVTIGTSVGRTRQTFPSLIDSLCKGLSEGLGWRKGAKSPGAGDGGLDVVVWRHFSDMRSGRLIAFAQCKTGIHWEEDLGKLNPRSFCHSYFQEPLVFEPIPIYMVPNRIHHPDWKKHTIQSRGILLDRCRISQFASDTSDSAITECRTWLKEAFNRRES